MITAKQLRAMALSLPEAEERETWGEATFRVREKIFLMMSSNGERASVKASLEDQAALVAMNPEAFSVAAYTGRFGWVSVQLAAVDPAQIRELVVEAWRRSAPKRLAAAHRG